MVAIVSMEAPERLRTFREDMGWTRAELGEYINLSVSMIGLVESGKRGLGLKSAFALQDLSADYWDDGPIDAREWCEEAA
jgi:transcriptional regulator with XRE-family HTH domain